MNSLVFGKYIPIDSIIHRLDPRIKLIGMFVIMIALFIPKDWQIILALALLIFLGLFLAKVGIKMVAKAFKPMIFMMVFLLAINIFSIKTGAPLLTLGKFVIYSDAIFNTLFVVVRLVLMISLTTLLTATTKPLDLTLAIEWLLKPLMVFHFPAHEIAMMVSIALRFIPTIIEETMRTMNAQKSRGVDFENGKLKEKIKAILSLIVPLFSLAFERAYELADAMEARGYQPGSERTSYHVLKFAFRDFVFLILALGALSLAIVSKFIS